MQEMTVFELKELLEQQSPLTVVDIRTETDYNDWYIAGSKNMPVYTDLKMGDYSTAITQFSTLPKDRPVVAVCYRGNTSKVAAEVLQSLNIPSYNLAGGITAWSAVWTTAEIDMPSLLNALCYQVRRNAKGCLSYFVAVNGEAAVIDPAVDNRAFLALAEKHSCTIVAVLETHVHADHISRARQLAEETGATLYLPRNNRTIFSCTQLSDNEVVNVGGVPVSVIATPGHTGESVCYSWCGHLLFTGDTLFVESVGRPDLEKGDAGAEAGAGMLYESIHNRIMSMPPHTVICPGHTSGMIGFDRAPIVARLSELMSSIGYLKQDRASFVPDIVAGLSAKPPNFQFIISINEGKSDASPTDPLVIEAGPNRCAVGK